MAIIDQTEAINDLAKRLVAWYGDPELFVADTYAHDPEGLPVDLDEQQRRILRAIAKHDKVAVRSCHGAGKTAVAAIATKWWLSTRKPALVVTLAGTWNHLKDKLWPEIRVWSRGWRMREAFEWLDLEIKLVGNPDGVRAMASSSDDPNKVEGWHNPNLLVIIDEAKALPDDVRAAIQGAMTAVSSSGARPKQLVLSTPPLANVGWYADLFGRKSEGWHLIHVRAQDSHRVSPLWIQEMAQDFGVESAVYQSKVDGDIPEGDASHVVHTVWIDAAQLRQPVVDRRRAVSTCDVARGGEDLTTIGRFHEGRFTLRKWKATNDTMQCAGMCRAEVIESGAKMLIIDDTGVGGGVTDRLMELQHEQRMREERKALDFGRYGAVRPGDDEIGFPTDCAIIACKFGSKADRDDRFANLKAELWWTTRDALKEGTLGLPTEHELAALQLPRGSNLRTQLAAPIYDEDSRSRIIVVDHKDTTDRREKYKALPSKSPDLAHALILGVKYYFKLRPEEIIPATPLDAHRARIESRIRERIKAQSDRNDQGGGMPSF